MSRRWINSIDAHRGLVRRRITRTATHWLNVDRLEALAGVEDEPELRGLVERCFRRPFAQAHRSIAEVSQ